ncbi:PREDICTED: dynamin-binding protein-like [Ceratosolen solmsi marchali]|uniref:Dynamin-binding protein n=1 Tax=Ceratosolen solmsi marchali TaxID=326594 RepID=A0AAJ6YC18_9HYME|nr:PREDICTED: dynamin-binding protein-like [Ceratosolen solmsi marchali]
MTRNKNADYNKTNHIKGLCEPHRPAPPAPPILTSTGILSENQKNLSIFLKAESKHYLINQKKADQRQNIITELYLTEKDYLRDLKITYRTFNLHDPNFLKSKGIDVTTLFGNILEIIYIAEEFLKLIERPIKNYDEKYQCIVSCFLNLSEKMKIAYGKYCSNHELSLALLQKYENNEEIMKIFYNGVKILQMQIACFDMNSILIKPVQRILKYSLILNELLKYTEDDHPNKFKVVEALKVMEDVARYINEYKRKIELTTKYLKSNNTLIGKIAKLNMHSVAKKSCRLSAKLSVTLGLTNVPIDQKFDKLEKNFIFLEKTIKHFLKDIVKCIIFLDNESHCNEIVTEHLHQYFSGVPNNKILELQKIRNIVKCQFIKQLKTCIGIQVISPLNILMPLLAGPELLISKRHDKMLDYDSAILKNEKSQEKGPILADFYSAKYNFEALNQQLLEELPICIQAATAILCTCISAFIKIRKLYNGKIMREYLNISKYMLQISMKDMLINFLINHKLLYDQINRFSYGDTNIRLNKNSVNYFLQSDVHRTALKMKYPTDKLYIVTQSVSSVTQHDLSVTKGTMLGVIKRQDLMGNKSKWLVDNGSLKGFLEKQYLELIDEAKFIQESTNATCLNNSIDLISLDLAETEKSKHFINFKNLDEKINFLNSMNLKIEPKQLYKNICEFVHGLCNFNGTEIPGALSIRRNQILKVLKKHDNKNNPQWWLVEDCTGQKGYVPYNYIYNKET